MPVSPLLCAALLLTISASPVLAAGKVTAISTPQNGAVPDAEVDSAGVIHMAWVTGENAFYARSSDSGAAFSAPLRINSNEGTVHPLNTHRGPDLALDGDGGVHVLWFNNSYQRKRPKEEWGAEYARLKPGASAFEPQRNLNHRPSEGFALAASHGKVTALYFAEGAWILRSRDGGETFGDPGPVTVIDPCPCCAPRIAYVKDDLLITLRDQRKNDRDMFLLRFSSGSNPEWFSDKISTRPWRIEACPMSGCSLTQSTSGPVIAWETQSDLSFASFDQKGARRDPVTLKGVNGKFPIALIAPDKSACLSWKQGETLHWQKFTALGLPDGPAQQRKSTNACRHAAVLTKEGDFLLID